MTSRVAFGQSRPMLAASAIVTDDRREHWRSGGVVALQPGRRQITPTGPSAHALTGP